MFCFNACWTGLDLFNDDTRPSGHISHPSRVSCTGCLHLVCVRPRTFFFMMTSSNGNIFRVTGLLCGEFTGPGEFPTQRPVTRSFDVFFDLRLNKRLSKQPWGWWFETPSWSLWRQCNVNNGFDDAEWAFFISNLQTKFRIISRGVPCFATGSPCSVWGRGWTTCLLYDGQLSG